MQLKVSTQLLSDMILIADLDSELKFEHKKAQAKSDAGDERHFEKVTAGALLCFLLCAVGLKGGILCSFSSAH